MLHDKIWQVLTCFDMIWHVLAFRKSSPSVALTGKDSRNERISIASRSFIFWPIWKIRLQKKVGSKFSDFRFRKIEKSKILKIEKFSKDFNWKFSNFRISKFSIFRFFEKFQLKSFESFSIFKIFDFSIFRKFPNFGDFFRPKILRLFHWIFF